MEITKIILEFIKVLIWPITLVFILVYFKEHVGGLFSRLKSAKLPGGVSFELDSEIKEVIDLSDKLQEKTLEKKEEHKDKPPIENTKANLRLAKLGLRLSPSGMDTNYYRDIAKSNPNLALAGLRMEVEILIKNLANGFKIKFDEKGYSGVRLVKLLLENHAILENQYQLLIRVLFLCDKAEHGENITESQAMSIIESADALIEDYLAWLSWGFDSE